MNWLFSADIQTFAKMVMKARTSPVFSGIITLEKMRISLQKYFTQEKDEILQKYSS